MARIDYSSPLHESAIANAIVADTNPPNLVEHHQSLDTDYQHLRLRLSIAWKSSGFACALNSDRIFFIVNLLIIMTHAIDERTQ